MEKLSIQKADRSPSIEFDAETGILKIEGRMVPIYSTEHNFFEPIIKWLTDYAKNPAENTTLKLNIDFFSSSGFKSLYHAVKILKKIQQEGYKLSIIWIYDREDENSKEQGVQFSQLLKIPFAYVPRQ